MSELPVEGAVPDWTLGWRMQRALAHAGISAGEMAAELEVSRGTLSRWLNDRGARPRAIYLRQWALRCGVSYRWLLNGNPQHAVPANARSEGFNLTTNLTPDLGLAA